MEKDREELLLKSTCTIYQLCSQRANGTNGVPDCQNAGRKPYKTKVIAQQTSGIGR